MENGKSIFTFNGMLLIFNLGYIINISSLQQSGTKGNRGMYGIAIFPIICDKFYV